MRRMPGTLRLALRNLGRQRRRTGLALSAISFGIVALLLAGGFIEWIFWGMREGAIHTRLGHIQVVRPGYIERGGSDAFGYLLPEQATEFDMIKSVDHVQAVAPRLVFNGLISHNETTLSFIGEGVDPEHEKEISQHLFIRAGEDLSKQKPGGVILGTGLAASLGVQPGDSVILLATTVAGGINAVETRVAGVFYSSSKAFDDAALRVSIEDARQLLRVSGSHVWVVLLDDTSRTAGVLRELQAKFAEGVGAFEFVPWNDLADFYNKTVVLLSRQIDIVKLIIGLIIVLSISNVLIMSVLDRTAEIGTLMAVGIARRHILRLFLGEGCLLGIIGGIVGLVVGFLLSKLISAIGIPMPPPPGVDVGITGRIMVTLPMMAGAFVLAVGTTLIASLYPAWKASRLEIVDALRHSR